MVQTHTYQPPNPRSASFAAPGLTAPLRTLERVRRGFGSGLLALDLPAGSPALKLKAVRRESAAHSEERN